MTVNQLLKHTRLQAGLTQAEFADRTGLSQKAVSEYENGKVCPGADKMEVIFDALGMGFKYGPNGDDWELVTTEVCTE